MQHISHDLLALAFKILIENHQQGICVLNAKREIIFVNQGFCHWSGFFKSKLLGKIRDIPGEIEKKLQVQHHWHGKLNMPHHALTEILVWGDIYRISNGHDFMDIQLISAEKNKEIDYAELWKKAHTDSLTQLANRDFIEQVLSQLIQKKQAFAFVYLDLDGFKHINDLWGHEVGDALLIEVAHRLDHHQPNIELVSRLHGDEFGVILNQKQSYEKSARTILNHFHQAFLIKGQSLHMSACLGISEFPKDGKNAKELIHHADEAMQKVKALGNQKIGFYDSALHLADMQKLKLTEELNHALMKKQFELFFHPIFKAKSNLIQKVETLIRWNHPEYGQINPVEFLPLIQHNDLWIVLSEWIFKEACYYLNQWGKTYTQLQLSINIPGFLFDLSYTPFDYWHHMLNKYHVLPSQLIIEITEESFFKPSSLLLEKIILWQKKGLKIALDDFGTGFTSLSYLTRIPVNFIKINREFVSHLHDDVKKQKICKSIIDLAHQLNIEIIAEDVEHVEDKELLEQWGIDYLQGFLLASPMDAKALEKALMRKA